ncbi:hypothetical protein [Streptomyces sp. NPDC088736]
MNDSRLAVSWHPGSAVVLAPVWGPYAASSGGEVAAHGKRGPW